jgi:hypothetical protein
MRLLWIALLPACIDNELQPPGGKNQGPEEPVIEVRPLELTYETLALGEGSTQTLTVRNIGLAPLTVVGAQVSGTTAFTLLSEPDAVLEPEEELTFDIAFSPVNPEDAGSVVVLSDDPESPSVEVPLSGAALVGELAVLPNPLDFGDVPLGCSQSKSVTVQNVGSVDLTIDSMVPIGDDAFGADWDFDLPLRLAAGESLEVPLIYAPDDLEEDEAEVWITSDAIVGLTVARQRGGGTLESSLFDEWWQGNGPWSQTDIVFYVDQSGSMSDDQERLRQNFTRFVTILEGLDLDWQIMVITNEDGCHNEQIINRDTADASGVFSRAVEGPYGRWTEAGLSLVAEALRDASEPGGCNEGFLRTNAKTTAVMVSDEVEQSRQEWSHYVGEMRSVAPSIGITSIVGDVPDGCATADPGIGYVEASLATGGAVLSICNEDWSSYFETIASLSALGQTDTFVLSSIPDPASILVNVDGAPSTAWSYDATWNAIVFPPEAVPAPGVQIQAWYDILADCEG